VALAHLGLCNAAEENFLMLIAGGGASRHLTGLHQCYLPNSLHNILCPADLLVDSKLAELDLLSDN